ncbi:MAG: proline--tRNA ligase [Candidatus Omnitrophota bacterium]|jgi:prolyl-tRNA synthetase
MRWSKTLIPTLKEVPQDAESTSHKLLLRAGLVRMLMAGAYSYLPLGLRVLENIQNIIRQEMSSCSASELLLPALQPLELWQRTGRDQDLGEVMFKFTDRRGRKICLGPTHEETITDLVRSQVSSYKQLPLVLYQIQTKFRDEIRPRFGLIRACEFIMKDAYSFDSDEAGLDKNYQAMYQAYLRIFKRCGLNVVATEADSGVMGGKVSHEFMVPAQDGEDVVTVGSEKVNAIEIGHIFKLGTKYSASLGANFLDANGKLQPIIMGCYGIGVSRLISAVIEQNNDKDGIIWPDEVTPYKAIVLSLDSGDKAIKELALNVYQELGNNKIDVLFDDRDERAGVKFKDADLLGIPLQIIVGKNTLKDGTLELKTRRNQNKVIKPKEEVLKEIINLMSNVKTQNPK